MTSVIVIYHLNFIIANINYKDSILRKQLKDIKIIFHFYHSINYKLTSKCMYLLDLDISMFNLSHALMIKVQYSSKW